MALLNRNYILLGLSIIVFHLALPLMASNCYQTEVPNGLLIPNPCLSNATWTCTISRNPVNVTNSSNPFGIALRNNNYTWTESLCRNDSDGDGLTNGEELGDPDCIWMIGNPPNRTTNITHPGICDPVNADQCYGKQDWLPCAFKSTPMPTQASKATTATNASVTTSTNSAAGLTTSFSSIWIITSLWLINWFKMIVN